MRKIIEAGNIVESKLSSADRNGCSDDNGDGGDEDDDDDDDDDDDYYGARMLAGVAEEEAAVQNALRVGSSHRQGTAAQRLDDGPDWG